MPMHEYKCPSCGYRWEEKFSFNNPEFSDASISHCPKCNVQAVKIYGVPAIIYKAGGFYSTDHKENKND